MSRFLDISKAAPDATRRRRFGAAAFVLVRLCLAVVFIGSGLAKLTGHPAMTEMVGQILPGEGFRWAIGIAQLGGGALLLLPRFSAIGAALLFVLMLCIALLQYVIDSGMILPALGLLYLCFAVFFERSSR